MKAELDAWQQSVIRSYQGEDYPKRAGVPPVRGLEEVPHSQVALRGGFWGPRLKTHHEVTVPHALDCLEKDGHMTNFDKAAGLIQEPLAGHAAFDSDLHKALEGAMYALQLAPDAALQKVRRRHPRPHPCRAARGRLSPFRTSFSRGRTAAGTTCV